MPEEQKCHCMVCIQGTEFERILKTVQDPSDKKILMHFWNALGDAETTAEVWKMRAEGAWPGWEHNKSKCAQLKLQSVKEG